MTLTAESALISITGLKETLTHAINFLVRSSQVEGVLPADIQFGVRILQSRQRLLDRLWFYHFGDGEQQEKARIELNLAHQDIGELIRLGDRNHGVGRLDCRACEFEYGEGGQIEALARLCSVCHMGIRHVYQKQTDTATHELPEGWDQITVINSPRNDSEVGEATSVPPTPQKPRINDPVARFEVSRGLGDPQNPPPASKLVDIPIYRLFWRCDNCLAEGMEK